jgi:hypothetical protein
LIEQHQRQASRTYTRIASGILAVMRWLIGALISAQFKNGSGIGRLK